MDARVAPRLPAQVGVTVSIAEIAPADEVTQITLDPCAFGVDRGNDRLGEVPETS
jgi:hypothetical protein